MKSLLYSICLVVFATVFTSTWSLADNLNLNTGSAEVLNATSVSLQNLILDEQFYNAVIQLNLDGTYNVLSVEPTQIESTAKYEVVFESTWSAVTHPYQFPRGQRIFRA